MRSRGLRLVPGLVAMLLGGALRADAQAIKVGSFTKATGTPTATQVVSHGLGQMPKALILWTDGKTNETFSTDYLYAFGMTDGTTSKSVAMASRSINAAPVAARRLANKALAIVQWDQTVLAEADLQSWDATNFTLSWTTNNATGYVVHFIAIGGPGVSAKVVNWTMATATGNQSITGVGFTPDVVLHAHIGDDFTAAAPANAANAQFGLGAMDRNGGQWANDVESVSGVPSMTMHGQRTNACIYGSNSALAVQKRASFVSMDPDGFTVNFTTANANASQVISLALKGVRAKAGSFLKSTSSSLPAYVQSKSAAVGGVASLSMAFSAASTTGDLIVVSFNFNNQARTVTSVTDNRGNVYSRAIGPQDWGTNERAYTYYAPNITGGAVITLTITLSGPATSFIEAYAGEYSGVAAANPLDQTSFATATSTGMSSGSKTTLSPVELIWGFCDVENGSTTATGPINVRELYNWNFAGDWTVSSTGTYAVTGTVSPANPWACHMATFRGGQSVTGVGFQPSAVLLSSVQDVTQANPVAGSRFGVGAADNASGQGTSALTDRDAVNPTVARAIDKTSKAFVKANNDTGTINAEAVVASFDPDGFSLSWTTNDAVATQIVYLALGPPITAACSPAAKQPWYDASWSYRKVILVDHTKVAGDLVDFPVLVSLASDADLAAHARSDGFDILFTDSDGTTRLSHQIESYDGTGTLVAWVKVPLLPAGSDKLLFMYFGNASAPDQQSVNATWSNGYQAVWHLSEASGPPADYIRNSALNDYHGTPQNTAFTAAGKIDGARTFSDAGYSNVAIGNSGALFNAWTQFSLEVWIYPDYSSDAVWQAAGEDEFLYSNTGPVRLARVRRSAGDPAGTGELQVDVQFNTAGTQFVWDRINRQGWNHVVYTYDGSNFRTYFNGVQTSTTAIAGDGLTGGSYYVMLGHDGIGGSLRGSLDEVRISNAGRSRQWVQTEYANQNTPATFCAVCGAQNVGTTAVRLASFAARGFESSVLVEWETASELDNLGFHLYRGLSADGPWTRLNVSMIPGLASSPEGKQYRWVDGGLSNGTTYFYRLEDVDRHGQVTSHGPVSAMPVAGLVEPGEGGDAGDGGGPVEPPGSSTPPPTPERKAHGDPTQQSLRVLERTESGVTLELRTGGFYSEAQPDGTSKLLVPGFFDHAEPGRPTIPTRRLWTDAVVGRGVRLVSVEPSETVSFSGLDVSLAGKPVALAPGDGTYRAAAIPVSRQEARRLAKSPGGALFPTSSAAVHQTAFQGEHKKAYVELAPLQVDEATGEVTLARSLLVRLAFAGRVAGEQGQGSLGRRAPAASPVRDGAVLARFATHSRGLYTVAFEDVPGLSSPVSPSDLCLSRLGVPVAFHLEPRGRPFGPGSVLFFLGDGTDTAYSTEAVYELAVGSGGVQMPGISPSRTARSPIAVLRRERSFEKNAVYLPGLVEARDLWLWDYGIAGGQGISYPFTLDSPVLAPETARLTLDLQGGSDTAVDPDHHVLAFVNGSLVGETSFDGMVPHTLTVDFPTSLLLEGDNALRLENAGDTGSTASFVYLDRFSIEVPGPLAMVGGVLEGRAAQAGRASVGAAPGAVVLDTTGTVPRFLARSAAVGRLSWNAEADHRYLAVSPEAFLRPEVRPAPAATLQSPANQADWIVVAPQALLPATEPLVALRQSEGLTAKAVSYEDVVDEFGYGEAGSHAVQSFLAFAFHHWRAPSPRYVLLLGEASYDPKGRLSGTSRPDLLPSPLTKSTYLWTAADPLYAAVNGEDSLPDIAVGRITAATLEEAQAAIGKILAFETSGRTLTGKAALVADNPDLAGDFEANQDEIATLLSSRTVEKLYLSQLGIDATKAAVKGDFDTGLSLMSYVGHGSSGLWASEGILRSPDVDAFEPQPAQPLVLTMTCSNGYFLSPYVNSLAEKLVLAEGKGAIAAFSPSGLSLDEAAHVYHQAVVSELESGQHARLGDLLLAAQADYAATGAFPELLQTYTLFGDPGTRIR